MSDEIYTIGAWRVKDGKQAEFVEAWKALGRYFRSQGEHAHQLGGSHSIAARGCCA